MWLLKAAIAFSWAIFLVPAVPDNIGDKRVVCYYGSWAVYRWGAAKISPNDIKCELCTHFIYTFVGLDDSTNSVKFLDQYNDVGDGDWKKSGQIQQIKKSCQDAGVKFLVAIGGWNEGSEKYSRVVGNPSTRAVLVDSIYKFIKTWGLDGFDIDWEYPAQRGGVSTDKAAYSAFLAELHDKFKPEGLILSTAVSANVDSMDASYDVQQMSKSLDFINIMAYDLHGSWESVTGHNAPLYARPSDYPDNQHLNIESILKGWVERGADPSKINLGLGAYGRSFTLADPSNNGIGAPAQGLAPAGWTTENGFIGFDEICAKNGTVWTTAWDDIQQVPYAYSGNQWVGYDDPASIRLKVCMAKQYNIGGVMIWSVETDDFHGNCGQGPFPLLRTMASSLADPTCGGPLPPQSPATTPSTTTTVLQTSPPTEPLTTAAGPIVPPATATAGPIAPPTTTTPGPIVPPTATTVVPIVPPTTTTVASTTLGAQTTQNSDLSAPMCQSVGDMVGDPNSVTTFYICAYGQFDSMQAHKFVCPGPLVFDPSEKGCVYAQ